MEILGTASIAMALLTGASMAGLLIAGPVSRLTGKFGGAEIDLDGDES